MKSVVFPLAVCLGLIVILTAPALGKDLLTDEELDQVGAAGAVPLLQNLGINFTPCPLCSRPTAVSPQAHPDRFRTPSLKLGNFGPCPGCEQIVNQIQHVIRKISHRDGMHEAIVKTY